LKSIVFISSGVGNALLLVPMVKELRKKGTVWCLDASPYFDARSFFSSFDTPLFDGYISIHKPYELWQALKKFKHFDYAYLDFFASTRYFILLANIIAKRIVCNKIPARISNYFKKNITLVAPILGIHEGEQYLRYITDASTNNKLNEAMFSLEVKASEQGQLMHPYITIQPGTGNNKSPWKNWTLSGWHSLINSIINEYPDLHILIIGDSTEVALNAPLAKMDNKVIDLTGKTKINELPSIISASKLHLGGDSSLMHLSACLGVKTIILQGGSDLDIYGYATLNPNRHLVIKQKFDCHPCSRWILPNRTRTSDPSQCPDFRCIRAISAEQVMEAFRNAHEK